MTDGILSAALVVAAALVSTCVLYALAGISVPVALGASIAVAASMAWMIGGGLTNSCGSFLVSRPGMLVSAVIVGVFK